MFRPEVTLHNSFRTPYDNSVATARTCYSSKGIVTDEEVRGEHLDDPMKVAKALERRDGLAASVFDATHHTTLQHAHFQFALSGISRQFTWAFLHSHPHYNSEQVSQRYVEVRPENVVVPPFDTEEQGRRYCRTVAMLMERYSQLADLLMPTLTEAYLKRFPGRKDSAGPAIRKKALEVARYLLPVGAATYMYHTVSALTLLRYYRTSFSMQQDTPNESRAVVQAMVDAVLERDPAFAAIFDKVAGPPDGEPEEPLLLDPLMDGTPRATQYDDLPSQLIDWPNQGEAIFVSAIGEVIGCRLHPNHALGDREAAKARIGAVMRAFSSEALNLDTHHPLTRAMNHIQYVFRHCISHTADSQDQRHRTTPGSRPMLTRAFPTEPDYVTPTLIEKGPQEVQDLYHQTMVDLWAEINGMGNLSVPAEYMAYLLPNAVKIRYTESGTLLAMKHKMRMRLCLNAQEEIFRMAVLEAEAIRKVHPMIGEFLLPPCKHRHREGATPPCPEGDRYCGVRAWTLDDLSELVEARGIL